MIFRNRPKAILYNLRMTDIPAPIGFVATLTATAIGGMDVQLMVSVMAIATMENRHLTINIQQVADLHAVWLIRDN